MQFQDTATLKEDGNNLFKAGDMQGAICCYTEAIKLSDSQTESAVLHRNRSACYLKLENYTMAEVDAAKGRNVHNSPFDALRHQLTILMKLYSDSTLGSLSRFPSSS